MTAQFSRYIAIDWSAANAPSAGKNSIWIAVAENRAGNIAGLESQNIPTRSKAVERVRTLLKDVVANRLRTLVTFDFAFGYPKGAGSAIGAGSSWRELWRFLAAGISDDEFNRSNRFEFAAKVNQSLPDETAIYWGRPKTSVIDGLSPTRPTGRIKGVPQFRITEQRARGAQPVWKLAYPGSVGSQTLLGIPKLEELLSDPELTNDVVVWPFQTGFGPASERQIVFAEIYPSLFPLLDDRAAILDQAQVEAVATGLARLDAIGELGSLFERPASLSEEELHSVLNEEGWILGVGKEELLARARPPRAPFSGYVRDPEAIYAQSFATIRAEADLRRFSAEDSEVAERLIHACGMVDIAADLEFAPGAVAAGTAALKAGASVICDAEMVRHGIIKRLLPASNPVLCALRDPDAEQRARTLGTTRSAAALDLLADRLEGAIVAIGNAPTALFHLIELLEAGGPRPALILGFPVGFVGAAESKQALAEGVHGVPFITLKGRRGGSAMAAAAVNALAKLATR